MRNLLTPVRIANTSCRTGAVRIATALKKFIYQIEMFPDVFAFVHVHVNDRKIKLR